MSSALKPGRSVSTRKPRIRLLCSSDLAQITATSAMEPEVIHIFSPLSTYSLPIFFARVLIPLGLEPKSGSVKPKHPIFSPLAMAGSHFFFCSSLPNVLIGCITSEGCTPANERIPLPPHSSSRVMRPEYTEEHPS